ncbi:MULTISPECIES: Rossmann-like and DUF2520 domain-containing protein [unclassified Sphingopyxis]|uniref:Rossmann-like and DUF2520 domain-containing protein n=1 Tax=unclassified Sphingopyxis TaxID=2614943 RepID=UPI000736DB3C|nr:MULTISPECIES: DUF2520 domain-containing protein [unclassified Sphingopyxis]KTE33492.1 cytoplasmic protein [Sphingopyxis sp. HIX]KTE83711.1 cytoplasmic protein [Sphingopyxis sp. HXXIV]
MGVRYQRVGIAGSGRVARALALALAPRSAAPVLLWGRSLDRVHEAAATVGGAVADNGADLIASCDLIVIAVADAALAEVATGLAEALAPGTEPFICHVSGGSGAAILAPLHARGALTAAVHPAMTFTGDPTQEVERMAGARFAITAPDSEALAEARTLVSLLGGIAVEIAEDRRALYHAALSHAANHLVTLISGAAHALRAAGADEPEALLAPLVRAALENSLEHGFDALSGPLLRGDADTIRTHLDAIARDCPDLLPDYRAMALATLDELARSGKAISPDLRAILTG